MLSFCRDRGVPVGTDRGRGFLRLAGKPQTSLVVWLTVCDCIATHQGLRRVCLVALLLALVVLSASAASPKRVLILDPYGRDVAPFSTAVSSFRTTLVRELGEPVDVYELPLELARFAKPKEEDPLVTFLEQRLKEQSLDLVVPIGTAGIAVCHPQPGPAFPYHACPGRRRRTADGLAGADED